MRGQHRRRTGGGRHTRLRVHGVRRGRRPSLLRVRWLHEDCPRRLCGAVNRTHRKLVLCHCRPRVPKLPLVCPRASPTTIRSTCNRACFVSLSSPCRIISCFFKKFALRAVCDAGIAVRIPRLSAASAAVRRCRSQAPVHSVPTDPACRCTDAMQARASDGGNRRGTSK